MKSIVKGIVVTGFYFVISANGHFTGSLSFKSEASCLNNAYAMSQQLPDDQISYCYNDQTGQPIVTNIFNETVSTANSDDSQASGQ